MAIRNKSEVIKTIKVIPTTVRGKTYQRFWVYFGTDRAGIAVRASRGTRAEAMACINEFFVEHKRIGETALLLSPAQIYDAEEAFKLLLNAGIRQSLSDTVRKYLDDKCDVVSVDQRTLGDAYTEYYASFPEIQKLHRRAIKYRVRPWVTEFGPERLVSDVTAKDLAGSLAKLKEGNSKTYNNKLSYIKSFLQWCADDERRYVLENPAGGMKRERICYSEPKFLRTVDFERLVRAIEAREDGRKIMAYIALHYMCGVRREEITRIAKEAPKCVLLAENSIRVSKPKGWTQGRKPRMFTIPPNAAAWLKWSWDGSENFCYDISSIYRILEVMAKELKIKLPRNAGRHTFITMHVAAFELPETTDNMTGTSSNMRSTHYQGLVSKKEAEEFFSIMPLAVESGEE